MVCVMGTEVALAADYTPPAAVGDIWVAINYKQSVAGTPLSTDVKVQWGSQTFTKTVSWVPCVGESKGFVLKMAHKKADAVKMTVTTSGTIVSGPKQGPAPSQWAAKCWSKVVW